MTAKLIKKDWRENLPALISAEIQHAQHFGNNEIRTAHQKTEQKFTIYCYTFSVLIFHKFNFKLEQTFPKGIKSH